MSYRSLSPEVVQHFSEGIRAWQAKNLASARASFEWCTTLDSQATDAWRALASIEDGPTDAATPDQVIMLWETRRGYGELLLAANLPPDIICGQFNTGMWGLTHKLGTKSDIAQAYALQMIEEGRWKDAEDAIKEAGQAVPFTSIVRAFLFYKARRWGDVIRCCDAVANATAVDRNDHPLPDASPDFTVQGLASLMAGEALSRLGRHEAGIQRLQRAANVSYGAVSGWASFISAMSYRALGNDAESKKMFAAAMSRSSAGEIVAAADNPTVRLETTTEELIADRTDYWDCRTEKSIESVEEDAQAARRARLLEEADRELEAFIGMEDVKRQVLRLKAQSMASQVKKQRGIDTEDRSYHLIFTGPPGTGKTTLARVIGKMYAGLGITEKETVAEKRRTDFIGNVQGDSGLKTMAVIEEAMGGILFIDEAYSLVQEVGFGQKDAYGQEVVDLLVSEMENRRRDLVVILAGYDAEIERLLATNEGLKNRFTRKIKFKSYTPEEIWAIAEQLAKQRHGILGDGIEELITTTVRDVMMTSNGHGSMILDVAGNGRFVRNLLQGAEEERELRLLEEAKARGITLHDMSNEELLTITESDVAATLDRLIQEYL